jgi:hypothetical protein
MAQYQLVENDFTDLPWIGVFGSHAFFDLHAGGHGRFFRWHKDGAPIGAVHFTRTTEAGNWRSPLRGTFAGYSFAADVRLEEMFAFHSAVEDALKASGAKRMEVLLAPMAHDPVAFSHQTYFLRSSGFSISQCDLNQSLEIDNTSFSTRISYGNLKRIRKCDREGFVSGQLAFTELPRVFDVLSSNRRAKGNELSMSQQQLHAMLTAFPQECALFGCEMAGNMVAAAFCLQLSPAALYVVYWGDLPGYESHSPTVHLANAVYTFAQNSEIRILDVGTSTIDLEPNFGLLQFKRGLGFTESLKLRMTKELAQ